MGICCVTQETQTGALYQRRGVGWGERWEGVKKRKKKIVKLIVPQMLFHAMEKRSREVN